MPSNDPPKLHFTYSAREPNLEVFDVKRAVPTRLLGEPAVLTVIGESHYVGVPTLDFHEICSCKPIPDESAALSDEQATVTPLERGVTREFAFENDLLRVETEAEVRAIEEFPGSEDADVAFRFGPDAWTTISLDASGEADKSVPPKSTSYETYHTYPEYGLAVYTLAKFRCLNRVSESASHCNTGPRPTDD